MREFFIAHLDYIFFVYGLAFILLAVSSYFISRARPAQVFWKWIALFGLAHGITEWLDMLTLSLENSIPFKIVKIAFLTASFLCFVEVVRSDAQKRWGKISGPWIYAPLLSVTLGVGWILGGFTGINILSRYVFGAIGGLLAARVIVTSADGRDKEGKSRMLFIFAWALSCYAATQVFAPKGTFLPASMINQDMFFSFAGFPVQLLRMALALVLAGLAWKEYSREMFKRSPEEEEKNRFKQDLWLSAGLAVILLAGGLATEFVGRNKDAEERNHRLNCVKIAAAMINPDRIKALSGTTADLQSDHYKRIREQFLNILKDDPDALYVYLFGQKNGKNVFLVDSKRPDKKPFSGPLAAPGEVYEEDAELLRRMFASGGAVTVGPETDKWGTFISSLCAIRGPEDERVIAVLGFDYDAKQWSSMIARYRLDPILITLLFALLFMMFFVIFKREQETGRNVRASENVLRKSKERLTELTAQVPGVVYQFYARPNGEMGFYFVSKRSEQVLGLKPDVDRYFEHFTALVIPEHRESFIKSIEKSVKESSAWSYEGMLQKPTGEKIWFAGNSNPSPRENELVFNGIVQDITERKQRENQYETIVRASMDGFWIADIQGNLLEVNDSYCEMVGYSREELLKIKISDVEVQESPEDVQAHIRKVKETGSHRFETRHKHKNGSIIDVEISVSFLRGMDQMFVFMHDITERKKTEAILRESEGKYRLLAENLTEKIFLKDGNSVYVFCNKNYARDLKIEPEKIVGKLDFDFFPKELAEKYRADDKKVMESGESAVFEEKYAQDGHEGFIHTVKTPVRDEQDHIIGILGIFSDITERKKAEEIEKKQLKELETFYKASVGREERIIELKREIQELRKALDEKK